MKNKKEPNCSQIKQHLSNHKLNIIQMNGTEKQNKVMKIK